MMKMMKLLKKIFSSSKPSVNINNLRFFLNKMVKETQNCERKEDEENSPTSTVQVVTNQQNEETQEEDENISNANKIISPYPKGAIFVMGEQFFTRFAFNGVIGILPLYLRNVLKTNEDDATIYFHLLGLICYVSPVFSGLVADSFLGKYKTVLIFSVLNLLGFTLVTLTALPLFPFPAMYFIVIALIMVAVGSGGNKNCQTSFGADQYIMPEQEEQRNGFFSILYFTITAGILVSYFVTPILRKDVACFGENTCYPLAFGFQAVFIIIAFGIFLSGTCFYRRVPLERNIIVDGTKCILHALINKFKGDTKEAHWLDYASDKHDINLIRDLKKLVQIVVLYSPMPVFFALFNQQQSRWTLQALRMDGNVNGLNYTIKPDQFQMINAILTMLLIPIFDSMIYPLIAKCGLLKTSLQRIAFGGILASAAFATCGLIELKIENTYAIMPEIEQSNLNFINTINYPLKLTLIGRNDSSNASQDKLEAAIAPYENFIFRQIKAQDYTLQFSFENEHENSTNSFQKFFTAQSGQTQTILLHIKASKGCNINDFEISSPAESEDIEKSDEGNSKLRIVYDRDIPLAYDHRPFLLFRGDDPNKNNLYFDLKNNSMSTFPTLEIFPERYQGFIVTNRKNKTRLGEINPFTGGSYLVAITRNCEPSANEPLKKSTKNKDVNFSLRMTFVELTTHNSVHMLWLLPQFALMSTSEVILAVTLMKFAYSEAPQSMKAFLTSMNSLSIGLGHCIIAIIAKSKFFKSIAMEFFLFAALNLVNMCIFIFLSFWYIRQNKALQELDLTAEEIDHELSIRRKHSGWRRDSIR